MDTRKLEEAALLIGKTLDEMPMPAACCEACGNPTRESRVAHCEREMLGAALTRVRRVVDHQKLGTEL